MEDNTIKALSEREYEPNHDTELGLLLKMIGDCLAKRGNAQFKEHGITMGQAHVLMAIHSKGSKMVSFKELERLFGVAQATMAGILARMKEKGFIEISVDPEDKRAKRASLTEKGHSICESSKRGIAESEQILVSKLTSEEVDTIRDLMLKMYEAVRAY